MILVRPLPIALSDRPELDQDAVGAAPMTQPSTTTESQRPRGPDARARLAEICGERRLARKLNSCPLQAFL
jgi:hypothetical protein